MVLGFHGQLYLQKSDSHFLCHQHIFCPLISPARSNKKNEYEIKKTCNSDERRKIERNKKGCGKSKKSVFFFIINKERSSSTYQLTFTVSKGSSNYPYPFAEGLVCCSSSSCVRLVLAVSLEKEQTP